MLIRTGKKMQESKEKIEQLSVSKRDAAKMLGLSESTVHHLTQSGELTCKRVGRRVIYSVEVLRKFLENND